MLAASASRTSLGLGWLWRCSCARATPLLRWCFSTRPRHLLRSSICLCGRFSVGKAPRGIIAALRCLYNGAAARTALPTVVGANFGMHEGIRQECPASGAIIYDPIIRSVKRVPALMHRKVLGTFGHLEDSSNVEQARAEVDEGDGSSITFAKIQYSGVPTQRPRDDSADTLSRGQDFSAGGRCHSALGMVSRLHVCDRRGHVWARIPDTMGAGAVSVDSHSFGRTSHTSTSRKTVLAVDLAVLGSHSVQQSTSGAFAC